MNQGQVLDLSTPIGRLQYVYENCRLPHSAGWSDRELINMASPGITCQLKNVANPKNPHKALSEYGFTRDDIMKMRYCPMPDCTAFGTLQRVLEHLNECHNIPIRNIGKLIPIVYNSTRQAPTLADHVTILIKDIKSLF